MNSLTTQLLNKSKTEKGFNQLNQDLQELRSRQEDNYHDYYYGGHYRDRELDWKIEGDGLIRKRWERDQELLKSFKELFTWDEKFRYEIPYKIASYDPIKFQSKWSDDKKVAVNVTQNQGKYRPDDIENSEEFEKFDGEEILERIPVSEIYLRDRCRRTTQVRVSNFQKIEKGFSS